MKFRDLLVSLIFVLASIKGYGQDTTAWSLPGLWERAFVSYPALKAYRSQQRQADIDQKLVRNQYLPDVFLQAQNSFGTQNASAGAFFPLPGLFNVNGSEGNNVSDHAANLFGSVVMDWKFFQFGRKKKAWEAAKITTNQAMHRLNAAQLDIQADLSRTYFQLLFHRHMQDWAQQNTARLQAIFQASVSRAKAGLSPGADSLLIKAALNQTSADQHEWQGRREQTKVALARWVNIPADHLRVKSGHFFVADTVPVLSAGDDDALRHPRLAYKKEQVAFAEKQKEMALAGAFPSLSLLGGVQLRGNALSTENSWYENWGDSYNAPVDNYLIGLGLSWDLGDVFDLRLERSRFREEVRQRKAEAEEVALQLRSQKEIARRQMMQSRQQITDAEQAYKAASQAYALFEARYNSGLMAITALLQIQDVLQKAEKTRIQAYYHYWIQQANLASSTGDFSYLKNVFK